MAAQMDAPHTTGFVEKSGLQEWPAIYNRRIIQLFGFPQPVENYCITYVSSPCITYVRLHRDFQPHLPGLRLRS